ncbi:MAG TPA: PilZ domain-containing protein [Myxococcaceae bacterium]|nr:PilZ domain-containing protein [Myxococcaceae bacterium]
MPGKIQNRRNVRVVCGAPAKLEGPRGPVKGTCRNLSIGGLFFIGGSLPIGQTVEITIELPDAGRIQAVGEIRYHHDYPEGPGMGIRFTRLAEEHLGRLRRYVLGRA